MVLVPEEWFGVVVSVTTIAAFGIACVVIHFAMLPAQKKRRVTVIVVDERSDYLRGDAARHVLVGQTGLGNAARFLRRARSRISLHARRSSFAHQRPMRRIFH